MPISLSANSMGAIAMYNYQVLECRVAFAIVLSIGFLVDDSDRRTDAAAPKREMACT